ncbi:hypothetical protein COI53_27540 [Bacillus thuringiensis]|uniref:hypothetical protein n=1 Tax=Bacillus thuringiensis TaxID=1428 RepID=UPI000BF7CFCB|nr:hypothetical protein [Bacillus thuringiensis]PFI26434.1 hypothetical protein COI53_27540 [Bacillus thuringiensis]PGQ51225.1 hypothetical protein COA16_30065 [Bacillus thuringiensis]
MLTAHEKIVMGYEALKKEVIKEEDKAETLLKEQTKVAEVEANKQTGKLFADMLAEGNPFVKVRDSYGELNNK